MAKRHGLTAKQDRFAVEYARGLSAAQAARQAGYSRRSAAVAGSRLSRNPKVTERVFKEMQQHQKRFQASSNGVLQELQGSAFANFYDYVWVLEDGSVDCDVPKLMAAAAAGILTFEMTERGTGKGSTAEITIGLPEKFRALELLWRHAGLSRQRQQPPSLSGIEEYSDDDLSRLLQTPEARD
jgi:hypothetical protein